VLCLLLYILALFIGVAVNQHGFETNGSIFPGDESLRHEPELSFLGLSGVITLAPSLSPSCFSPSAMSIATPSAAA